MLSSSRLMHPQSLIGRETREPCLFSRLSLFLERERERKLRRTYGRGFGFVGRIKKDRHIGFTFPYLRDHKPSYSSPAAIPPNAATTCRYDFRVEARTDWLDGGKRAEEKRATTVRALINFGVSYTRARDRVSRCSRFIAFRAGDKFIHICVGRKAWRIGGRRNLLIIIHIYYVLHRRSRYSANNIP